MTTIRALSAAALLLATAPALLAAQHAAHATRPASAAHASTHAAATSAEASAPAAHAEEAAVRAALQLYLDGHATGRGEHFAAAMHPVLTMLWVRNDSLQQRSRDAYVAGARGTPPADEAGRRRWIESVDVAGTAAMAKIVLDYPQARFTDYMSLLKVDGEWRIVSKVFHSEPRVQR